MPIFGVVCQSLDKNLIPPTKILIEVFLHKVFVNCIDGLDNNIIDKYKLVVGALFLT